MKPKSKADIKIPSARTSSVFDRLYKTQTAASRAWQPARRKAATAHKGSKTSLEVDQIFTRLHISGTIANTSKRVFAKHPKHPSTPSKTIRSPARTPARTPSTKKGDVYTYSPRMKPLTKLTFKSRYHPGLGLETIDPIKLGNQFFQSFCEYENCGIDSEQLAKEIIVAFFKKDFPKGRHWTLLEPSIIQKADESFDVKMSAEYDKSNVYRVASAHGVVRCLPSKQEVRVENYIYDVSGNP